MCDWMHQQPEARVVMDEVVQSLIEVAVGKVQHLYRGTCPDAIEGFGSRDPQCPACRVLTAAQACVKGGAV